MGRHVWSDEVKEALLARADRVEARLAEVAAGLGVKNLQMAAAAAGDGSLVYFVSYNHGATVKIGTSRHFPNRLAELRYYCPEPLTVEALMPGNFRTEKMVHNGFQPDRMHGEWFERSEYLDEFIAWVREEFGTPQSVGVG